MSEDSSGRLKRTCGLFLAGIAVQCLIVFLVVPAKAQNDDVGPLPTPAFGIVITSTGIANTGLSDVYSTIFQIKSPTQITQTAWLGTFFGELAEFQSVESNRGDATLIDRFQYSVSAPIGPSPLVMTITSLSLDAGLQTQNLLGGVVITQTLAGVPPVQNSVLAAADPLPFTLGYRVPSVIPVGVITDTYRIDPFRGVITQTLVVGEIVQGGTYRSVMSDALICGQPSITLFACASDGPISALGAAITVTMEALEPGITERLVEVLADDEFLSTTFATAVQSAPDPVFLPVSIDIQPGDSIASVRVGRHGKIPVAIYSTPDFDAVSEIDPMTLTFGRTGEEDSWLFCNAEDVNSDGLVDLICLFDAMSAGFEPGDTQGILTGQTFSGMEVRGTDSIRTVPPR